MHLPLFLSLLRSFEIHIQIDLLDLINRKMGSQKKNANSQKQVMVVVDDDDLLFFGRSHAAVFDDPDWLCKNNSL